MAEVSVSKFSRFINLLRELSVNWGDHSSGEPEQHLVGEVKFLSKLRLSEDIRRSKSTDIWSFFFIPPRLVTHVSMQQKNQFQKIKLLLSRWRQVTTFSSTKWGFPLEPKPPLNTSLLSEDGGRSLEMRGEEGVTPTYIYSAIVIWHNIVLISVVLLSASLSSYIYFHISNV